MSPVVAVLVPWDVAICMVTIVHQNADISMSGVGVSCSRAIGGCVGGKGDCDGDGCGCGCDGAGGG